GARHDQEHAAPRAGPGRREPPAARAGSIGRGHVITPPCCWNPGPPAPDCSRGDTAGRRGRGPCRGVVFLVPSPKEPFILGGGPRRPTRRIGRLGRAPPRPPPGDRELPRCPDAMTHPTTCSSDCSPFRTG